MAKRVRSEALGEFRVSLTSMLDLVFNILAFFVMTYKPPLSTKDFQVNLPPPKASEAADGQGLPSDLEEEPKVFQDLTVSLAAGPNGDLAGIRLETTPIQGGPAGLVRQLTLLAGAIQGAKGERVEAVNLVAAPNLKYGAVMAVVDACYQAGIKQINFSEAAGPAR